MSQKSIFDPVAKELVPPGVLLKRLITRDGKGRNELHDSLQSSLGRSFGSPTKLSDIFADRRQLPLRDLVPLLNSLSLPEGDKDYYTAEFLRAYIEPSLTRFVGLPKNDDVLKILRETNQQLTLDLAYAQKRLLDLQRASKKQSSPNVKLLKVTIKNLKARIRELLIQQAANSNVSQHLQAEQANDFAYGCAPSTDELLTLDKIFVSSGLSSEHRVTEYGSQKTLRDVVDAQMSPNFKDGQHDEFENYQDIPFEPDSANVPGDEFFDDYEAEWDPVEEDAMEASLDFSDKTLKLIQAFVSELADYQTKSQSSQILLSALLPSKVDHQLIELGSAMSNGGLWSVEGVMQALPKIRSLSQLKKVIFLMWLHEHSSNVEQFGDVVNFINKMEHEAVGEIALARFKRKHYDTFVASIVKTFSSEFPNTISLFSLSSPSFTLQNLHSIDFYPVLSDVLHEIDSYGNVEALFKTFKESNLLKLSKTFVNKVVFAYCTHVHPDCRDPFLTLNHLERQFPEEKFGLLKRFRLAMKSKNFQQLVKFTDDLILEVEPRTRAIYEKNMARAESMLDFLRDEETPSSKEYAALDSMLEVIPCVTTYGNKGS